MPRAAPKQTKVKRGRSPGGEQLKQKTPSRASKGSPSKASPSRPSTSKRATGGRSHITFSGEFPFPNAKAMHIESTVATQHDFNSGDDGNDAEAFAKFEFHQPDDVGPHRRQVTVLHNYDAVEGEQPEFFGVHYEHFVWVAAMTPEDSAIAGYRQVPFPYTQNPTKFTITLDVVAKTLTLSCDRAEGLPATNEPVAQEEEEEQAEDPTAPEEGETDAFGEGGIANEDDESVEQEKPKKAVPKAKAKQQKRGGWSHSVSLVGSEALCKATRADDLSLGVCVYSKNALLSIEH